MAENKNIEVGGRLHSIATGNVLAGANEIFDDDKNKKQNDINTETYSLVNDINERLNGLSPDQQSALNVATKATNNEIKLGYYVCDTEGNLAAKVISDATGYVLSKGGNMKVKMTNINTAMNVTLNINSTGAKPLYYNGERVTLNNSWEAGETVEVYYDGTSYYANNVAGGSGSGDGAFDISAKTGQRYETLSAALAAANTILSTTKKKGGMSIKFIQLIPATYFVVKREGLTEQPAGIELQSASAVISGTYNASQLSDFATLPASIGITNRVTYYIAVSKTVEEVTTTTYTSWVIIKDSNDSWEYVQYRLMSTAWSDVVSDWQGLDDEPTIRSKNLLKSGGMNATITKIVNGDSIKLDCYDFPLYGRWVNGNKNTDIDWRSSDLISITPGSTIKFYSNSNGSTGTNMITFFKKDKTFLSRVQGSNQNALVEYDATAPEDAWYVAFSKSTSNIAISNASHYVITYNDISASKLKNYINELNDKTFSNENRINNVEDILDLSFIYNLTDGDGKYFTANGGIAESGPYAISDVIRVHTGDILSIQTNIASAAVAIIVSCDSEGNNRSALVVGNSSKSYSYTVVNDGYIRFCVWKSDYSVNMQRRNVITSIENNVSVLQSKVEDINGVLEITDNSDVPVFTENSGQYIVWGTGAIGNSSLYSYSSPILLGSNKKIKLKSHTAGTASAITKCDSSGNNRITLVKGAGDFISDFAYANTSEEDVYVIVCYRNDHAHSVSIVDANAIDGINKGIETLAEEGNALDNRLTAEEEKVSNINDILNLSFEYTLEDGKYFTSTSVIGNSGPYSISNVIPVNKGDTISINTNISGSSIAIIVSCDSSGSNISPLVVGNSTKSYSYTANESGYIRFCVWTSDYTVSMQRADVIADLQSRVTTIEEALDISSDITTPSFTPTAGGYVVWANGDISTTATVYSYTSPILLEAGKKIVATCASAPAVAAITKCDSSGENRVPLVRGTGNSVVDYTFINSSDEDIYVVVSYRNNLSNNIKIYNNNVIETINGQITDIKKDIEELQSATEDIDFISVLDFCKFAETCICIGDSVTAGHIYDYPRTSDSGTVDKTLSYPAALQKLTGWNVTNAGKSGWTATKWYESYAETYNFSDYDICIIEFGYNAALTDTLDTDVEPYDNYENFANTETGNYCRIIARALSQNPNIFIVLNISPYLDKLSSRAGTSEVIKKIAAKYELPIIDLGQNTLLDLNANKFHGQMSDETINMVHMNAVGYFAKGIVVKKYLDKYFEVFAKKLNLIKY